jgi:hypothetical protein
MRAFVKLRELLATNHELAGQLAALERRYDAQLQLVFQALNLLMAPVSETLPSNRRIGFRASKETQKTKSSSRKR